MTLDDRHAPRLASPARFRWQVGMRAVILLVVAAALGSTVAANRRRVEELAPRIERLRQIVRELDVADFGQFAAIERRREEPGVEGWDVYIPANAGGPGYRICLATRSIDRDNFTTLRESAPIAPGRHTLNLTTQENDRGSRFEVFDGEERRLAIEEPKGWIETTNNDTATVGARTRQSPADRPLVLIRRRYMKPDPTDPRSTRTPDGPAEGVMLWVEPAGLARHPSPPPTH